MKKLYIISLLCLFFIQFGYSQAVPQGMKYQAVARDHAGEILGNQKISLKISLYTTTDRSATTYSETHTVTTNQLGLFTLTVGNGRIESGEFSQVPWSTSDIWMEIAIKGREDSDFKIISASKMLSVPYAFHAATASELINEVGGRAPVPSPGVKSNRWEIVGNLGTVPGSPDFNKLGTMDRTDLVIVTGTKERMRLFAEGNIEMLTSLFIEDNLTVRQDVDLNSRTGSTRNHGPFTVTSQSPTWLTGILTVDGATSLNDKLTVFNQSPTLLSGTLTVDRATDLNSSLNVDGFTDLNSALFVNNSSPTLLSGKLLTMDDATFNKHVKLDNSTYNSFTPNQGALVVDGGVGIGRNLTIGEDLKVLGSSSFEGPVAMVTLDLSGTDQSNDITSGALTVVGGAGLGKNLNVGGNMGLTGDFTAGGKMDLATDLNMGGKFSLIAAGGVDHVATFKNTNDGNGISIQLGASTPHNSNNFVTFLNESGAVVGRIEGENGAADLANNGGYIQDVTFRSIAVATSGLSWLIAGLDVVNAIVELAAATSSSTFCAGVGACVTTPIPSWIVKATADIVVAGANLILETINLAVVTGDLVAFTVAYADEYGVTYASGAEDYAEYLPKYDANETFLPGDIVGMRHGFITKNTYNVDRIMIISHNPVVLGGIPQDGNTSTHEMVAFMGQVPARIMGPAEPGDYILPSGYHNGFGIARSPDQMKSDDYKKILGVAWEGAKGMKVNVVNVAIGLNTNDMSDLIGKLAEKSDLQQEQIQALQSQIQETNAILAQLLPGFKEAAGVESDLVETPVVKAAEWIETVRSVPFASYENVSHERATAGEIMYYEATDEELEAGFAMARDIHIKAGVDLSDHPFWQRIENEPGYKEEFKMDVRKQLKEAMHYHKKVNAELGGE